MQGAAGPGGAPGVAGPPGPPAVSIVDITVCCYNISIFRYYQLTFLVKVDQHHTLLVSKEVLVQLELLDLPVLRGHQ